MQTFPFLVVLLTLAAGLWASGPVVAQSPPAPFPDVPPWHWAYQAVQQDEQAGLVIGYPATPRELVGNSIEQVYAGFAHARATGAQAWIERFTYNRPATWPDPLDRSRLVAFSLNELRVVVTGDTATAAFTAQVTTDTSAGGAQTTASPMRIDLRQVDGDWKIDYATLAQGSTLFR
ncbi:MAG TPA: hypothetical protein VEP50_18830 [bacterium]|nr:hypothetical protein [bacterium]